MADIIYIEQGYYQGDNYFTYTADAQATVNVTAQIQCDVIVIKQGNVNISSAFSPTLTASVLKNHTAVLDAQFNLSTTASRIASNQSTLDAIIALSLQADRSRALTATTLSTEFTINTTSNATKSFNSTFNPAFSINADGDIVAQAEEGAAALSTAFSTECVGAVIKGVSVSILSEFNTVTTTQRIRSTDSNILIAFQSANIIVGFVRDAQAVITDAFSPTITASALKNHTAVLDTISALSCVVSKTTAFTVTLNTELVISTQGAVTRTLSAVTQSAFTLVSTVVKSVSVSSAHSISFVTQIVGGQLVKFTDTITIQVTDSYGSFYLDGVLKPEITLLEGNTYIFVYPSNHPIAFSTTANGTHGGGTEYTTGITRDSGNNQLIFVVGYNTPTLYYYCQVHSNMGNTALTPRPTYDITSSVSATSLIFQSKWFNSHRPMNWIRNADHSSFSSAINKIGSYSLKLSNNATSTSDTTRRGLAYTTEPANINTAGDFVFETWFYIESPTVSGTYHVAHTNRNTYENDISYTGVGTASTGLYWNIQYVSASQDLRVFFRPSTTTFEVSMNAHNMAPDQWNHIAFRRFSNTLQVFLNGTKISVDGNNGGYTQTVSSGFLVLANNQSRTAGTAAKSQYYDGLVWKQGDGTLSGYSNGNSAPTPLLPNHDEVYTLTLNNFENNLNDTLDLTLNANATVSASVTVTATAVKRVSAAGTLNSVSSVTAIIGELFNTQATLNTQFTHTTTGTRIKQFDIVMQAEFTHSVTAQPILRGVINVLSESTLNCTITRIFVLQSNFESIATQLTTVARVGAGLVLAETFVTQSTTAMKTAVGQADATVVSAVNITAERFRLTTANTQLEFNLNAQNSRIRALNSNQNTEFVVTAATDRIRGVDSTNSSAFTIFCEPLPIIRGISTQSAVFSQQIIGIRNRLTTVTLTTQFTQQATAIIAVEAVAVLSTQAQITCAVNRIRPGVVVMDAIAVNVTVVAKTGTGLVTIVCESQCNITAQKITDITLNVNTTAQFNSIIERIQQGVANITVIFTQIANGTASTDVVSNTNIISNTAITAHKTARTNVNISSVGGFVMLAVAVRNNEILVTSVSNCTITGSRLRNTTVSVTNTFGLNILAGLQASASSVQATQFGITATVAKLRLEDIVLYVKTESRNHSINNEQRTYALKEENRLYTIEE